MYTNDYFFQLLTLQRIISIRGSRQNMEIDKDTFLWYSYDMKQGRVSKMVYVKGGEKNQVPGIYHFPII